jgi:non-specific serine/threonine protein kinase/serine/threonine-protein kinase
MGAVYLAVRADDQYNKQVALKVVQAGIESEEIIRRFRHERQILASLEHPNIARLLDGGVSDDGLPYFVMDYVEGVPLHQYCDEHRLSINQRIALFRTVCSAVHYVHQNLIVHRDLKPSNILVTADGTLKLLDFGIAKLLKPEFGSAAIDATRAEVRLMTPGYASPEQVRGEPVTTATDVYSLGVILYELLTGHRPYRLKSNAPGEVIRVVCEQEPEKPSEIVKTSEDGGAARSISTEKLARQLYGDLDNIVLKALRKEPQRRYLSVEQFAEDLRRHVEGLPVTAHADSLRYRAGKFVQRHRAGVAAAALIAVSLIAGIVSTTWQAQVARSERARAERRFNDVRKLANTFLFQFDAAIRDLSGSTPARRMLVENALQYLSSLAREASGDAALSREVAEAYLKVGDVQGNPYISNLGDAEGALASYGRALAIVEPLSRANPSDLEARRYLARGHRLAGEVLGVLGKPDEAVKRFRQALAVLEALSAQNQEDAQTREDLASCYETLGDVLGHSGVTNLGDRSAALENYQKALAIDEIRMAREPGNPKARRAVAILSMKVADMQVEVGDWTACFRNYNRARALLEELSAADLTNAPARRAAAMIYGKIAYAHGERGEIKDALANYQKAVTAYEALVAADPANVQARMDLASAHKNAADLHNSLGEKAAALSRYRKVAELIEPLATAQPSNALLRARHSQVLLSIGDLLAGLGQSMEAQRLSARGLALAKQLADREDATAEDLSHYANSLLTCEPSTLRDAALALAYAKRAVALSNGAVPEPLRTLAEAQFQSGDPAAAIATLAKVLALLPPAEPGKPATKERRVVETTLARFKRQAGKR